MKSAVLMALPHWRILLSLIFCHASIAWADAAPAAATADALERSLSGTWIGALEYRDYQSGKKYELPMTSRIDVGADGATMTRVSAFDDGPKTGTVYITTMSLFDAKTKQTTSAVFRKGRSVETMTDDAVVRDYKDAEHWTVVYSRKGTDGDSPAEIRIVQSLAGSELYELKEVKPVSAPDSEFVYRNRVRLRRK